MKRLPADLKAIGASFSQLITAVMISRLVLNLRVGSSAEEDYSTHNSEIDDFRHAKGSTAYHSRVSFMTRTIGNLGADIRDSISPSRRSPRGQSLYEMPMVKIPNTKMPDGPQAV